MKTRMFPARSYSLLITDVITQILYFDDLARAASLIQEFEARRVDKEIRRYRASKYKKVKTS